MADLHLIVLTLARLCLSLIISYATWLILRANILRSHLKEEEHHA